MDGMTTGQIVGSIGGAIIGGMLGGYPGAMLGMSIGGLVGGWVDPPPAPEPDPLGDLGLNTYVHNAPVPLAYGQNKVYGGCIWIGDMGSQIDEGGSKKNPEYTPQMWVEFAIAHCEGPCEEILGYWINDQNIEEVDEGMSFTFRSYLGTTTQTPDGSISSFLDGSNISAPGYIHTCYTYVYAFYDGGYYSSIPNFSAEIRGFLCESGEEDANPIRVLYDFMTNARYGLGMSTEYFDGDPDTADTSWYIAAAYCDETVSYEDEEGTTITEPRFRYSNVFTTRIKAFDIVNDILQTCRGIIAWSQGLLFIKIENENEEIINHYSDSYTIEFTSSGGSTTSVSVGTISEPDRFWEGAYLSFIVDGITYSEMVLAQGAGAFTLVDPLPIAAPSGVTVLVTKDNIKEGTFNWLKASESEKSSVIRLEYINRAYLDANTNEESNQYLTDVVEHEQPETYIDLENNNDIRIRQIKLNGIKRRSQAMRMARWFGECNSYLSFYCDFITDVVGYFHTVGDIVTITHQSVGWEAKEFRIIGMEEMGNDEIKLRCLEYNRTIYSDDIGAVVTPTTTMTPSLYTQPPIISSFVAVQSTVEGENRIYLYFSRPENTPWFSGVQVWVRRGAGGDWTQEVMINSVRSSVELSADIDDTVTTIGFDPTTLSGQFTDGGAFYIGNELIEYGSIVDEDFINCVRGAGSTTATAHSTGDRCFLYASDGVPYFLYADSDVGITLYIRLVSTTISGISADFDSSPEVSLLVV